MEMARWEWQACKVKTGEQGEMLGAGRGCSVEEAKWEGKAAGVKEAGSWRGFQVGK